MSHTAGLTVHGFPGYDVNDPVPTLEQIFNGEKPANTAPIRVDYVPGTQARYSGGGVTIEQQLMMDVTGKPFPALMREIVLDRIGMTASILVVDDETDVADLFRQQFRRETRQGTYVMHFADSGETALEKLSDGIEPTLIVILSDINMPGMDGLQLLGEIKRRRPDLPVMMVTAYGDDERRRRADELGAFEFVTKPVDFVRLKEQLRELPTTAD